MTSTDFDPATAVLADIAGDYTLDPAHSRLGFSARHAMVTTVRGQFTEFAGTAHVDTANPANSKVEVSIVANSISTGNEQRDGHLLSGDFFETEQFPEHHLHLHRRHPRRRRLDDHRRPDHQGRHQADLRRRSSTPARPRTRSATPGSASRARPPSTARTGA